MKIVVLVARILLGLIFVVFGLNGFLFFFPPPPVLPQFAGEFTAVVVASHFTWLPSGVQVIAGLMLLANRYVPFAVVVLAAVIANILMFHITMYPAGLPMALVVTVLWFVVALPLRLHFAPLFARIVEFNGTPKGSG